MSRRSKLQIKVEYDVNYTGGDYNGVGQFIILSVSKHWRLKDLHDEFRSRTGLPPQHIVHYETTDLPPPPKDNLMLMEKACRARSSS